MKHSHTCPKCQSRRFLITADFQVPEQDSRTGVSMFPAFTYVNANFERVRCGEFEMWTCASCGFTEWYAIGIDKLDVSASQGRIRYVDAGAPAPYR